MWRNFWLLFFIFSALSFKNAYAQEENLGVADIEASTVSDIAESTVLVADIEPTTEIPTIVDASPTDLATEEETTVAEIVEETTESVVAETTSGVDVAVVEETTTEIPTVVDDSTTVSAVVVEGNDEVEPGPALTSENPVVGESGADAVSVAPIVIVPVIVNVTGNVSALPPPVVVPTGAAVSDYPEEEDLETSTSSGNATVVIVPVISTTPLPVSNTTTANGTAFVIVPIPQKAELVTARPATTTVAPPSKAGWWGNMLLVFGGILLLFIIVAMLYACCCMKAAPARRVSKVDSGTDIVVPIGKPIDQLHKNNRYVDETIHTQTVHHYRETKREPFTSAPPAFTPNNSFANANAISMTGVPRTPVAPGVIVEEVTKSQTYTTKNAPNSVSIPIGTPLDGQSSPYATSPSSKVSSSSGAPYKYITPRHYDQSYIHSSVPQQQWNRRLDTALAEPVSSHDVIAASRVNNAVASVAAAHTPLRGSPRNSRFDDPELQSGDVRVERSVSPTGKPVYRTTINITPLHNRDSIELGEGETLRYGKYVDSFKGPPSDFAQYSPDRKDIEKRTVVENTESKV